MPILISHEQSRVSSHLLCSILLYMHFLVDSRCNKMATDEVNTWADLRRTRKEAMVIYFNVHYRHLKSGWTNPWKIFVTRRGTCLITSFFIVFIIVKVFRCFQYTGILHFETIYILITPCYCLCFPG
jgi:hypothetical protein